MAKTKTSGARAPKAKPVATFTDLLSRFSSMSELANRLGKPYGTVAAWKHRGAVPERYWAPIAQVAKADGVDVSYEALSAAAAAARAD